MQRSRDALFAVASSYGWANYGAGHSLARVSFHAGAWPLLFAGCFSRLLDARPRSRLAQTCDLRISMVPMIVAAVVANHYKLGPVLRALMVVSDTDVAADRAAVAQRCKSIV